MPRVSLTDMDRSVSTLPKGEISLLSPRPYMKKNGEEQGLTRQSKQVSFSKKLIDRESAD